MQELLLSYDFFKNISATQCNALKAPVIIRRRVSPIIDRFFRRNPHWEKRLDKDFLLVELLVFTLKYVHRLKTWQNLYQSGKMTPEDLYILIHLEIKEKQPQLFE